MPPVVSRAVLASAICLFALQASAQPVPKISSRDEYRACLEEQEKIAPRLPLLKARHREHDAALKKFQDDSKEHAASEALLDTNDEAAVDAFNARVEELNHRSEQLNARADAYEKDMAAYNSDVAAMNKRCAGMVYLIRDRDAVARERAARDKK